MKKQKTSPSPWNYQYLRGKENSYPNQWNIIDSDENVIAGVRNKDDAKIIKSAPTMFLALQAIANMNLDEGTNHSEVLALCMAIANIEIKKAMK